MKLLVALALALATASDQPWMVTTDPPEIRAQKLLSAMNKTEVLHLFAGRNFERLSLHRNFEYISSSFSSARFAAAPPLLSA